MINHNRDLMINQTDLSIHHLRKYPLNALHNYFHLSNHLHLMINQICLENLFSVIEIVLFINKFGLLEDGSEYACNESFIKSSQSCNIRPNYGTSW